MLTKDGISRTYLKLAEPVEDILRVLLDHCVVGDILELLVDATGSDDTLASLVKVTLVVSVNQWSQDGVANVNDVSLVWKGVTNIEATTRVSVRELLILGLSLGGGAGAVDRLLIRGVNGSTNVGNVGSNGTKVGTKAGELELECLLDGSILGRGSRGSGLLDNLDDWGVLDLAVGNGDLVLEGRCGTNGVGLWATNKLDTLASAKDVDVLACLLDLGVASKGWVVDANLDVGLQGAEVAAANKNLSHGEVEGALVDLLNDWGRAGNRVAASLSKGYVLASCVAYE